MVDVVDELEQLDDQFPRVDVPHRPVSADELLEALADDAGGDQPTQELALSALSGVVVDEPTGPQPARHEGLAPAAAPSIPAPPPVPSVPFLNAGAAHPQSPATVRVGNALPSRLTAWELQLLGRHAPADAPAAVQPHGKHARPTQTWEERLEDLAGYWAHVDRQFKTGPTRFVKEKSAFDLNQVTHWSEHLRQKLHQPYAHGPSLALPAGGVR
jgi:hypothetical protein